MGSAVRGLIEKADPDYGAAQLVEWSCAAAQEWKLLTPRETKIFGDFYFRPPPPPPPTPPTPRNSYIALEHSGGDRERFFAPSRNALFNFLKTEHPGRTGPPTHTHTHAPRVMPGFRKLKPSIRGAFGGFVFLFKEMISHPVELKALAFRLDVSAKEPCKRFLN